MDFCSLGRPFFRCRCCCCCCKNWLPKCNFLNLEAVKVDETHTRCCSTAHFCFRFLLCTSFCSFAAIKKEICQILKSITRYERPCQAQCILSSPEAKERRKNFLHFSVLGIFHSRLLCPCDYVIKKSSRLTINLGARISKRNHAFFK